jgi:hypothetical protein
MEWRVTTLKRLGSELIVGLVAVAGSLLYTSAAQAEGSAADVTPVIEQRYVLDFSASQDHGVPGGTFNNLAFNLELQPVRKISIQRGEQRKDFIATYDYADCTKGQEPLLQQPLAGLAPGNSMWVDYVDVEMIPLAQQGVKWTGGVCYGYRKPSGAWYWNLTSTPLTYDAATGKVQARIWVKEPNVDALKLVFDYSVPRQLISSVTITTASAKATPVGQASRSTGLPRDRQH